MDTDQAQFVTTQAIRQAVKGGEEDVLDALGVEWRAGRPHMHCPYRNHADDNASWRWDAKRARARCTCTKGDSIFDVVMKVEGCDFETSKLRIAEILNRPDLIRTKNDGQAKRAAFQATDAASLLTAPAERRDDTLPIAYLAHRLGVAADVVPLPSTAVVGLKALGYYDAPPHGSKAKPKLVGDFPCAVFATVAADGRTHAHRIYLAPDGAGKADLGADANGKAREPKKSAKLTGDTSIAGCAVLWGEAGRAPHLVVAEGIETGAALALAFAAEIAAGHIAVAAAISAGGMEAFQPADATLHLTIAADRDEAPKADGRLGSRRGEGAARKLGLRYHEAVRVGIALPGDAGESIDWLDVLVRDGVGAVRAGIQAAIPFHPTQEERDTAAEQRGRQARLADIAALYPVPTLDTLDLRYDITASGKIKLHKVVARRANGGELTDVSIPVSTPFSVTARLRHADMADAYGLRVLVQDMDGRPRQIDLDRSDLARSAAQEVRAKLLAAGLRFEDDGERIAIAVCKASDPDHEIIMVNQPGWHHVRGLPDPVFAAPDGTILGAPEGVDLEMAALTGGGASGPAGTYQAWRQAVQAACQVEDCPHWILGMLAGLAGPIVALTHLDTCGINLSGLSSGGKTLAQRLAVSAWTSPALGTGLLQSMRTTENALEHLARASNGTVLALDEAGHADGKAVGRMVYSIASGIDKARSTQDAGLQDRRTWSTFALLSGESSLEQKVTSEGGTWMAGMAVRIIDVDVNGVNRAVDAGTLAAIEQIHRHHGHAGPAFVAGLIAEGYHREPDELRTAVLATAQTIAGQGADSARIRAATPLALLQVAGTLAKRFGLLGVAVPVGDAVTWGWTRFETSSDGLALSPGDQAINNLRRWIAERWDVTIKPIADIAHSGSSDSRTNNREAVGWYDRDTVYLPISRAREAAGGTVKDQFLAQLLQDRGLLARRHDARRAAVRWIPGVGKFDAYALPRAEFGRAAHADGPRMAVVGGADFHE